MAAGGDPCPGGKYERHGRRIVFSVEKERKKERGRGRELRNEPGESTGRINSKMNLVKVKVLNEVRYQCSPLAKCAAATLFSRSKG